MQSAVYTVLFFMFLSAVQVCHFQVLYWRLQCVSSLGSIQTSQGGCGVSPSSWVQPRVRGQGSLGVHRSIPGDPDPGLNP